MYLLTKGDANAKTAKSDAQGEYLTAIMHLAPARLSGREVCASRSRGCTIACLNTAGRGRFTRTQEARIARTNLFFEDRSAFLKKLTREITSHIKRTEKQGKRAAVRLNGTSDLVWEHLTPSLFTLYPEVQFYDYTKHMKRCRKGYALPANYHLTFSRSETNHSKCLEILRDGVVNVAAVFSWAKMPVAFDGFPCYNADETDLRFLDPKGRHWGTLKAKGDAKKDTTGFVIHE